MSSKAPKYSENYICIPCPYSHFFFYLASKKVIRRPYFTTRLPPPWWIGGLHFCFLICVMVIIISSLLWLNERIHTKHYLATKSSKCATMLAVKTMNDTQFPWWGGGRFNKLSWIQMVFPPLLFAYLASFKDSTYFDSKKTMKYYR